MAGGIISIPVLSVGPLIALTSGAMNAVLSIFLGNFIILIMSLAIVLMSYKHRLNAVENAKKIVGKKAGRILAFFILISMIGWLARQLSSGMDKIRMCSIFENFEVGPLIGVVSALILLSGIRGLKKISQIALIPLIAFVLILMSYIGFKSSFPDYPGFLKLNLLGIAPVVGVLVASIVDYPTFYRHSKTKKDALISLFMIFFVTVFLQIAAVFLFDMSSQDSVNVMQILMANPLICTITLLFLFISMICSIAWNMYAASVGFESLFPKFKGRTEYALIGLVAIALIANIQLETFLIFINSVFDVFISAIGGVLVFEYFNNRLEQKQIYGKEKIFFVTSWFLSALCALSLQNLFNQLSIDGVISGCFFGFIFAAIFLKAWKIYKRAN
jgi:purine-cytosine permease-like protein